MPFYEYECANCKFYSEVMQKITDPPLRKCPSCGKNTMKKLVSAPIFRLKGGGWYETDFKSDQEKKRNLAVEKDSEPAKESKDTASDSAKTAPAKTAESKPSGDKPAKSASAKPFRKAKSKPKAAARRGRR